MRRPVPELLAPAGSADALFAAVAAGADAVYTGLGAFNARAAARDMDPATFARACRVAHDHGVRVYVTENVYLREGEQADAVDLARRAFAAGADALIVADAGLARLVREQVPGLELHLSTQAGVMSAAGARLAARELGVERVTCARELSVAEIAGLCAEGVPVEVFCHGAICICYSGSCSFSALRRGRSANRGDCTQPCRLSYRLEDGRGLPVAQDVGERLLCPRDYCSIRHLAELADAGVAALKIEGRMKNPDYVYNVVRTYRTALDALASGDALEDGALDELEVQLGRSFNRGLTDAYLRGTSGAELMSFERAINQGVRVGTVVERGHHEVVVELTQAVEAGDTLEIRTVLPPDAPADVPRRFPLVPCEVSGAAGDRIRVRCKRRVGAGSPVHLTASTRVLSEAQAAVAALRAEAGRLESPVPAPQEEGGPVTAVRERLSSVGGSAPARIVAAATPEDARALLADGGVDEVAVHAYRIAEDPGWEELLGSLTVVLDEPCRVSDEPRVRELCARARAVVCRNLGAIELARESGVAFEVAAPVSATNSATVRWLLGLGARRVWLPDELADDQVRALVDAAPACSCGVRVAGSPELMICEHCLLTAEGLCDGDHAACARRSAARYLVEADGTRLPVAVDVWGRTRIFDACPQDRRGLAHALAARGLGAVLVDTVPASGWVETNTSPTNPETVTSSRMG